MHARRTASPVVSRDIAVAPGGLHQQIQRIVTTEDLAAL
jgi:hypothetical protein